MRALLRVAWPLLTTSPHVRDALHFTPTPPTLFCNPRYLNFEVGPRYYELEVDVTDDNVSPLTVHLVFNVTIINVNDPPLLVSPNVTGVPENSIIGSTVYTFLSSDEDGNRVTYSIVGGNLNTGVRGGGAGSATWHCCGAHSISAPPCWAREVFVVMTCSVASTRVQRVVALCRGKRTRANLYAYYRGLAWLVLLTRALLALLSVPPLFRSLYLPPPCSSVTCA